MCQLSGNVAYGEAIRGKLSEIFYQIRRRELVLLFLVPGSAGTAGSSTSIKLSADELQDEWADTTMMHYTRQNKTRDARNPSNDDNTQCRFWLPVDEVANGREFLTRVPRVWVFRGSYLCPTWSTAKTLLLEILGRWKWATWNWRTKKTVWLEYDWVANGGQSFRLWKMAEWKTTDRLA